MRGRIRSRHGLFALAAFLASGVNAAPVTPGIDDPLRHVNPFIGTTGAGHVFPGASMPFGMAKAVADTDNMDANLGGFTTDESGIRGFSQMHDSGTGGSRSLGHWPFYVGMCDSSPADGVGVHEGCTYAWETRALKRRHVDASPGYFAIQLDNGVGVEITATRRTAAYRITLPKTTAPGVQPYVVYDIRDLNHGNIVGELEAVTDRQVRGTGMHSPSFGVGRYRVSSCAETNVAAESVHSVANVTVSEKRVAQATEQTELPPRGDRVPTGNGLLLKYPAGTTSLEIRIGLSGHTAEQACENLEDESEGMSFDEMRQIAREAWSDVLQSVNIDPIDAAPGAVELFYSSLYRAFLSPQDYTGENPLWESEEPYFDSYYCIWDSFRTTDPLLNIVLPRVHTRMLRSLVDIAKHEGWLPDCRMSWCKGATQGGSNADSLLADAYVKRIGYDEVDWEEAFAAALKDATEEPPDWANEGRGNLAGWWSRGYVATDDRDANPGRFTRSASRTVEYAYNDFSIALMARELRPELFAKFLNSSGNWRNLWDPDTEDLGFSGFITPRNKAGVFSTVQSPSFCSPINAPHGCYIEAHADFYETSSWTYSFAVLQDMEALIEHMGGRETFIRRLDTLFDAGLHDIGNEPAFVHVFLYHYVGLPHRSEERVRSLLAKHYGTCSACLPGNDDSGAQGSLVVWSHMGLFPIAGQDVYLLLTPHFRTIRFTHVEPDKPGAVIRCTNFDKHGKNIYIQRAWLNGVPWHRNWIQHTFFDTAAVLELELGPRPSPTWGRVYAPSDNDDRDDDEAAEPVPPFNAELADDSWLRADPSAGAGQQYHGRIVPPSAGRDASAFADKYEAAFPNDAYDVPEERLFHVAALRDGTRSSVRPRRPSLLVRACRWFVEAESWPNALLKLALLALLVWLLLPYRVLAVVQQAPGPAASLARVRAMRRVFRLRSAGYAGGMPSVTLSPPPHYPATAAGSGSGRAMGKGNGSSGAKDILLSLGRITGSKQQLD